MGENKDFLSLVEILFTLESGRGGRAGKKEAVFSLLKKPLHLVL
jgi:hypothetical protein